MSALPFRGAVATLFLVLLPLGAEAQTARDIHLKRDYGFEETLLVDCVDGFALRTSQKDACAKLLNSEELSDPHTSSDYTRRSAIFAALEDYETALGEADTAISLDSKNAAAFSMRGAAHWNLANQQAATADFERALELNPEDADAHFGRGAVHFRNAELNSALQSFDQAISLKPEFVAAYVYRGETNTWLEEYDEAIADFDTAVRLDPTDWRARLSRGNVHSELGNYELALIDYDGAARAAPELGAAYNSKAWLLATAADANFRDGAEAVRAAQMAVALNESDPNFQDTLAAAYAESGDFNKAVTAEEQAIELWRQSLDIPSARSAEERLALYRSGAPYRDAPLEPAAGVKGIL